MTGRSIQAGSVVGLWVAAVVTAGGCAPSDQTTSVASVPAVRDPDTPTTVPPTVVLPELTSIEQVARDTIRERHAAVETLRDNDPTASPAELARAYGSLGLVLMAADAHESAGAAFLNAVAHAHADMRWPYYLGQLNLKHEDHAEAAAWFERVLEIAPSDEAALVWLGRVYLDQSRFEDAKRVFDHATLVAPQSPAAWAGAGQVALAGQEYARAVESLERALAIDPGGTQAHYPLAMAYRSLGDFENAAASFDRFNAERLERGRDGRPLVLSDPLMLEYFDVAEDIAVQ